MFSENFTCPEHGMLLPELSPRVFSFNSPFGACEKCNGLGNFLDPDEDLVIPNKNLSIVCKMELFMLGDDVVIKSVC